MEQRRPDLFMHQISDFKVFFLSFVVILDYFQKLPGNGESCPSLGGRELVWELTIFLPAQ
jgi:hypothetical protein